MTKPETKADAAARDAVAFHSQIAREFAAKYLTSAAFRERFTVWDDLIERFVPQGGAVLDAGCGSGLFSICAARRASYVLGVDGSREMIALAEENKHRSGLANVTFKNTGIEDKTALTGLLFDTVLCSSVLEYVAEDWQAIAMFVGHLKPGGYLIFSIPNTKSLYRKFETMLFKTTGRPTYLACVRHTRSFDEVSQRLKLLEMDIKHVRYYSAAPPVAGIAMKLGRPELACNLVAYVCQRAE